MWKTKVGKKPREFEKWHKSFDFHRKKDTEALHNGDKYQLKSIFSA